METTPEKLKHLAQKSWDHIRRGSVKLALFMASLIGNGGMTTAAVNTESNDPAPLEKEDHKTEQPCQASKNTADYTAEAERMNDLMAEALVSQKRNTIGNFNLEGRVFSAEELEMIQQSKLSEQIQSIAKKKAKRGLPKTGQQTYCLGAVKDIYSAQNIVINAQRFAYRAVQGFKENEHFVEIDTNIKDFPSLPDCSAIAWEKGTTRYGHVAIKIGNKEYCDFVYNLRTHNRRGRSGQRYGKPHVFVLKNMPLDKRLVKKLIAEGRLTESARKQALAMIKIDNMKTALSLKDLTHLNRDWNQIATLPREEIAPAAAKNNKTKALTAYMRDKLGRN